MVWLESVLIVEATAAFWLSALNIVMLLRTLTAVRGAARRLAVLTLLSMCGAQAMEALLFLWLPLAPARQGWPAVALLIVRTALMVSPAMIAVLLLRAQSLHRRRR